VKSKKPNLYIIAGPNGAGKTTFAKEFLPYFAECREFVNADLIADGLSPFAPERAAMSAGKLMLERIHHLANRGETFGFETTLSGRSYLRFLDMVKSRGYVVNLFFLWIRDIEIALKRIKERVKRGGHNVPESIVRRRFNKGIVNLFQLYRPSLDFWVILENSTDLPHTIAFEKSGLLNVIDKTLFIKLSKNMEKQ